MKNSALKRIIAVVLCLVVFAGSELTGVTNIVGDLFAAEEEMEAEEQSDDAEEEEPAEDVVEISVEDETSDGGEGQAAETEPAIEESNAESAETETAGAEGEGGQQETVETEQPPVESAAADNGPAETEDQTSEEKQPDAEPAADAEGAENAEKQPEAAADADANTETVTGEEKQPDAEAVTDENKQLITEDKTVEEAQLKTEEPEQPEVPIEEEDQQEEEELAYPEFDEETSAGDGKVKIHVTAEEGVLPEGTELSVKPIVEQDVEALEADSEVSEEEVQEAKEIQQQFEAVKEELDATVADDDAKEIAHFLAYDISFYLEDEDGESGKIEPDGDVTVRMEFEEAFIPDSIANEAEVTLDSVDVVHMKETEDGLKAEVMSDAQISTVEDDKVADAEFVSDTFSIYAIAWIGEINPGTGNYIYEDEDVVITVTPVAEDALPENAKLQVIPILPEKDGEQYQQVADRLMEKAENEEYAIAGFLAYDISFVDAEGNKVEPDGEVKVAMNYKEAKIPAEVDGTAYSFADNAEASETETAADAELNVTVMHLEENEAGSVNVVDMAEQNKVTALETTKEQKIQNAEFVTGGFSVFTITWTWDTSTPYVYEDDEVRITITAIDPDAIPEGTMLSITPIKADNPETAEQYQEVGRNLLEKAVGEEYDIAGFAAYDISLVRKDGEEIEPNGKVKVTMEYKKATAPSEMSIDTSVMAIDGETADDIDVQTEAIEKAEEKGTQFEATQVAEDESVQPEATDSENGENEKSEISDSLANTSTISVSLGEEETQEDSQLNVTVMHLEEDEKGEVAQVVDLAEDGKVQLDVNENQEVKKVEFETETFSKFVITWTSGWNSYTLDIMFVDQTGAEIGIPNKLKLSFEATLTEKMKNGDFDIAEIREGGLYEDIWKFEGVGRICTFVKATVGNSEATGFRYSSGVQYKNSSGNWISEISEGTNNTVRFVYNAGELLTEDTVNNKDYGITIKMKNMTLAQQNNIFGAVGNWWIDSGSDKGGVSQGAVDNELANGYPQVKYDNKGSLNSLESLFSGGKEVNHLFLQDTYDEEGYFEYSSFENYAYLGEGTDFKVYKAIGAPDDGTNTAYFLKRGNFFPYNDIEAGQYSKDRNLYDEDGTALVSGEDDRYDELLYKPQGKIDYNFGMEMSASFTQPKGGKVNGEAMRYEFNGDDDLWVFIDNVLVLDMGGNHDARSGYIDFSTGSVGVQKGDPQRNGSTADPDGYSTTIKQMFENAGKSTASFKGNTFGDYTPHTLKMFYLERGNEQWDNASNLHMRMNIMTIPVGDVVVEKQITNTDKEKYADAEFSFQMYLQNKGNPDDQGNETYVRTHSLLTSNLLATENITAKRILTDGTDGGALSIGADGTFKLKSGEKAQFSGIQNNREYYVVETGVSSEAYQVIANDAIVTESMTDTDDRQVPGYKIDPEKAVDRPYVLYENKLTVGSELHITKAMQEGQSTDDAFTFRVNLGGIPYADDYYVKDSTGKYVHSDGTVTAEAGTYGEKASEGIISGIKAGYTVILTGIAPDTTFSVEEVVKDGENYVNVNQKANDSDYHYKLVGITDSGNESFTLKGTEGGTVYDGDKIIKAVGTIKNVTNAGITVTNSRKIEYSWKLVKKSSSTAGSETPILLSGAEFTLSLLDGEGKVITGEGKAEYFGLSDDQGLVGWYMESAHETAASIPEGSYLLKETKSPVGYQLSEEGWTVTVAGDGSVSITQDGSEVLPDKEDRTNSDGGTTVEIRTYYFSNEPAYELPATGGIGIHWYIVSGTLMMMLGLLILYKRKFAGEVLKG